jgi:hypothetical protein
MQQASPFQLEPSREAIPARDVVSPMILAHLHSGEPMNAIRPLYDTLTYAKKLKAAGFTEQQAEVQAEALLSFLQEGAATKADLNELETRLKADIHDLGTRMDARFSEIDSRFKEIKAEIRATNAETKAELIRWVVGVGILQFALITALLLKILPG